jgi:voltage-gated potassium channel
LIVIERRMERFLREPPSVRYAAGAIVTVTAVIVLTSGVLMRLLDHKEFPNIWLGVWWAIQTVTTVGYGDVTPKGVSGRVVAGAVMLEGIALLAVVTAAVTSTFVQRAEQERALAEEKSDAREREQVEARFDSLDDRLQRIETELSKLADAQRGH